MFKNYNFKTSASIVFAVIIIITLFSILNFKNLIDHIEYITYDWRARIALDNGPFKDKFEPASNDIVILTADDETISALNANPKVGIGRWPWKRSVWADVINFVSKGKPKAIVMDIRFQSAQGFTKEDIASDKKLARAIKDAGNVILAVSLEIPRKRILDKFNSITKSLKYSDKQVDKFLSENFKTYSTDIPDDKYLNLKIKKLNPIMEKKFFDNMTFYSNNPTPQEFLDNARAVGVANVDTAQTTVLRDLLFTFRLVKKGKEQFLPSLPLAAALFVAGENEISLESTEYIFGKRRVPVNEQGRALIGWHGKVGTYKYYRLSDVLITDAIDRGISVDDFEKLNPEVFKDKIVVIGHTESGSDIKDTPIQNNFTGPEAVATAIDNYLNDSNLDSQTRRKIIKKPNFWFNFVIVFAFALLIGLFNVRAVNINVSVFLFLLAVILYILIALVFFLNPNIRIWLNISYPILVFILTAVFTYVYLIGGEQSAKENIKMLLGKFIAPSVLNKILKNPETFTLDSKKNLTVLFTDIRNFTQMSEKIEAKKLLNQLNEYFNVMVDVVLENEGTMDKFIGDSIMAFYGEPIELKNHAFSAVKTAVEMQEKLKILNEKWEKEGKIQFEFGVGINTGDMIVGCVGADKILDYTVMGDSVNIAARVEDLNKKYKTSILITQTTYEQVKDFIEAKYIDEIQVRGKEKYIKVYEVIRLK